MFERLAASLPYEIQMEFEKALEAGYWSNGMKLTDRQRRYCEQALNSMLKSTEETALEPS